MERLTKRNETDTAYYYPNCFKECDGLGYSTKCDKCGFQDKVCEKLGEYEDLEEQGLLLKLPCKVGSTVYLICSRYTKCSKYGEEFEEYNCQGCEAEECDSRKEYYIHTNYSVSLEWIVRNMSNFGKTVFLTQSEAEEALKRMEREG